MDWAGLLTFIKPQVTVLSMMTPRTGRPLKGPVPTRDLPTLTFRLSPELKEQLEAASAVRNEAQGEILAGAFVAWLETLSPAQRRQMSALIKTWKEAKPLKTK